MGEQKGLKKPGWHEVKHISSPPQLTNPTDIEDLASNTQILTAKPEDLTPDNITTAAQIVQTLLVGPNVTEVRKKTQPGQTKVSAAAF